MGWPWRRKRSGDVVSMEVAGLDKRQQALLSRLPVSLRTEVLGEVPMTIESKRRQVDDITTRLEELVDQLRREAGG